MKKIINNICFCCILFFVILVNLSINSYATDFELITSKEFENWSELTDEEKNNTIMPKTSSFSIPNSIMNRYKTRSDKKYSMFNLGVGGIININNLLGASIFDARYDLSEHLDIRVENQRNTYECWAFSTIKSLEINNALINNEKNINDFSERHMDYATSQSFYDGINEMGLKRQVSDGGLPIMGLAYLINGQGAVLETDMPFEDNTSKISINDIKKDVNTIATDYKEFPNINKVYERDNSGNTTSIRYYSSEYEEYSIQEVSAIRNMIKEHLINKGAIISMNGGNYFEYYNDKTNPFNATTYNCNDSTKIRDHSVTIVGWDDNYSKDNFVNGAKPSTDGAYIVLNSYGENSFNKGYMYISYEDKFIEEEMYGITSSKEKDFQNIYQYDTFGGNFQIGTATSSVGYIGTKYTRKTERPEILNSVGITVPVYTSVNIYVNPNSSEFDRNKFVKVANSTEILEPGYHRIDITPIELTGSEFAIVVEQTGRDGGFYFSVEAGYDGTAYEDVTSEGNSFISMDFDKWMNLKDITGNITYIDVAKSDVCLKAFTVYKDNNGNNNEENNNGNNNEQNNNGNNNEENNNGNNNEQNNNGNNNEENNNGNNNEENNNGNNNEENNNGNNNEQNNNGNNNEENNNGNNNEENNNLNQDDITITSNSYKISDNNYITNVDFNTAISSFLNNVNTNSNKIIFKDGNDEITDKKVLVKTGMKIILSNGKEYVIIVKGDIKEDGMITLTDLSKLILHYNETQGFELTGNRLKAADMNLDGIINLVDISKMLVIYNEI